MANDMTVTKVGGRNLAELSPIQRKLLERLGNNIAGNTSVPSLTFAGKVWTINANGEKKQVMRVVDGEEIPTPMVRVIILAAGQKRGRAYYEGEYDPANISKPLCWSVDGEKPDTAVPEPQHTKCASCPKSVKGSKITPQGKPSTACAPHRMLVVVPANNLDHEPLRLKIAITSDWDANSKDQQLQGWYAFSQYKDNLRANGIFNLPGVVTRIKFDNNESYPKLLFNSECEIDEAELDKVCDLAESEKVQELLNGTYTPDGAEGTRVESPARVDQKPLPAAVAAVQKAAGAVTMDEEPVQQTPVKAAPKATPKPVGDATPKTKVDDPAIQALLSEWE
jgi:hypothetical protein